jgi:hypothetical protein
MLASTDRRMRQRSLCSRSRAPDSGPIGTSRMLRLAGNRALEDAISGHRARVVVGVLPRHIATKRGMTDTTYVLVRQRVVSLVVGEQRHLEVWRARESRRPSGDHVDGAFEHRAFDHSRSQSGRPPAAKPARVGGVRVRPGQSSGSSSSSSSRAPTVGLLFSSATAGSRADTNRAIVSASAV